MPNRVKGVTNSIKCINARIKTNIYIEMQNIDN